MRILLIVLLIFISPNLFCQNNTNNPYSWESLDTQSKELYRKGYIDEAIIVGKQALLQAEKEFGETHANYAESCNQLGVYYFAKEDTTNAKTYYSVALYIHTKFLEKKHDDYAAVCHNISSLFFKMGKHNDALNFGAESYFFMKDKYGERCVSLISTYYLLGQIYQTLGDYNTAIMMYAYAVSIQRATEGKENVNYLTYAIAYAEAYAALGGYDDAETQLLEAHQLAEKLVGKNHKLYYTSCNGLGCLYLNTGDYAKAEGYLLEALQNAEKLLGKESENYATLCNNLGTLYTDIDNYDKASSYFQTALAIQRKIGSSNPTAYINLATLYFLRGNYDDAERYFMNAKDHVKKSYGEKSDKYGTVCSRLATFYSSIGEYAKADSLYQEDLKIIVNNTGKENDRYIMTCINLATLYTKMGSTEKAETHYMEGLAIASKILGKDHPTYGSLCSSIGLFYAELNNFTKAEPYIIEANTFLVNQIKKNLKFMAENEKEVFINSNYYRFERLYNYFSEQKSKNPALTALVYDNLLLLKGLVLKSMNGMRDAITHSSNTELKEKYQSWKTIKQQISQELLLPLEKRSEGFENLKAQAESLEKEIVRLSSDYARFKKYMSISWEDVKNSLNKDEAAIEIICFNQFKNKAWTNSTVYYALIVKKESSYPEMILLANEDEIKRLIEQSSKSSSQDYVNKLYTRGFKSTDMAKGGLGDSLYHRVWAPIEKSLTGKKKLYISLNGILNRINLSALPCKNGQLLTDIYDINYLTSSSELAVDRSFVNSLKWKRFNSAALYGGLQYDVDEAQMKAMADSSKNQFGFNIASLRGSIDSSEVLIGFEYLKGTEVEVKLIGENLTKSSVKVETTTGISGTEESFKLLSGKAIDVIHIATHGFFIPAQKEVHKDLMNVLGDGNKFAKAENALLRSGLILAGGNRAWEGSAEIKGVEDGILTAMELSQMNLRSTELVVLSACETGLGDIDSREGVIGLQRGLKLAGVNYIIMSLWQVPDAQTVELMTSFYDKWTKGNSIEESFRMAQNEMRKKYDPFYWAAFVLVK